jgi:lactoylglutathione lyase
MEANRLYRGRLIDHVQIVSKDLSSSRRFYQTLLGELGHSIGGEGPEFFWCDELFISSTKLDPSVASEPTGPMHLAFQCDSREMVKKAYLAALEAGGRDDGKPGLREHYHPGYFSGYLLDPDGNFIEIVFHGPAKRSASAVELTW